MQALMSVLRRPRQCCPPPPTPTTLLALVALLCFGSTSWAFAPHRRHTHSSSLQKPKQHQQQQLPQPQRLLQPLQVTSQDKVGDQTDDKSKTDIDNNNSDKDNDKDNFMARCQQLCQERNLPFEKIKNARDLSSIRSSPIRPGRIFRMGRLSDASELDRKLLEQLNIQTLVDLRSPTELKDDPTLLREEVFQEYTDMIWKEQGRGKDGCLKELEKGEFPFKKHFWNRNNMHNQVWEENHNHHNHHNNHASAEVEADEDVDIEDVEDEDDDELCTLDCDDPKSLSASKYRTDRKERHFVSVMNELKYVKGTVSKVRKRDITKSILKSPGAIVSKRVRHSAKAPFLNVINGGGLPMLNELLLHWGAPGIKYVLQLVADRSRHPIAFYCAAGKDRTGLIAALILSLCGVSDEDIVEDYMLSANVYAEMNDHTAMVGALSQRSLDPKTFLGAPPQVMRDTLHAITKTYGSVEEYCTWIGFGPEQQEQLRRACMDDEDDDNNDNE